MEKSIVIIGGGLTGLAAGSYGRMNGYKTTIFEMHNIAGGVATAWKRKGYTIDGAMNWLMGSRQVRVFIIFGRNWGLRRAGEYITMTDNQSLKTGRENHLPSIVMPTAWRTIY